MIREGCRVTICRTRVLEFKRRWPCSNLPDAPVWFEFEPNGDLIDTSIDEEHDGVAAAALAEDARAIFLGGES